MRIAILTLHWASNYGAVLQALAAQEVLKRYGGVDLIDYRPPYVAQTMRRFRFGAGRRAPLRIAKDLARFRARGRVIEKFRSFIGRRLHCTEPIRHASELGAMSSVTDLFVAGSDQIWNPRVVGGCDELDPNFFLAPIEARRKISFASSTGDYDYSDSQWSQVREMLASFSALSMRESDTAARFSNKLQRDVSTVVDPTLLLSADEWAALLQVKRPALAGPYMLVYALHKDKLFAAVVDKVARQLRMRVVGLDQDPILPFRVDAHISSAGPEEFVEHFMNASFVITNSFHGVAFALNFGKHFVAVRPSTGANRIESLLANLGIEGRLICEASETPALFCGSVDSSHPTARLAALRNAGLEFLHRNIA